MAATPSLSFSSGCSAGREPAQLKHERDVLDLLPTRVVGTAVGANAVLALHEGAATAVFKHAYSDYHTVTFHLAGAPLSRKHGSGVGENISVAGGISVQASDEESLWNSDGRLRWMQFYLPTAFVRTVAAEALDVGGDLTLDRATGVFDRRLSRILYRAMLGCRRDAAPTAEEINAWALDLTALLLGNYSSIKTQARRLANERMTTRQFQKVTRFIDDNLGSPLSIADLARALGMSQFHFIRAFRNYSGTPPYQHILGRRINRACQLLEHTNQPLCSIAYETGFSSQPHLTSTFTRTVGVPPERYRHITGC